MKLLSVITLLVATVGIQQTMGHPAAGTAGPGKPPAKPNPPPANPAYPNPPTTTTKPPPAAPSQTVTINGKQLVYPALDITPNTNDPVVKQWISTLNLSNVPNLGPSNGGKVNYNPTLCGPPTVIAPNQGSWTCQKFVAPDDIADCPDKYTWGLTYDDGPSEFTPTLLAALAANKVHATFFVVGSRVVSRPEVLKNIIGQGHNVAVHTYSHPSLTSLSNEQVVAELKWTLKAIKDVIGLTPKYMRPPFGDTDNRVRAITKAVGLTTVIWTDGFDTDDWSLTTGKSTINDVLNIFNSWVVKAPSMPRGFLVLEHDLFKQTVDAAVVVIGKATKTNLIIKTVPQCVGDNNPYLESVGASNTASSGGSGGSGGSSGTGNSTDTDGNAQAADTGSSPSNGVALAVHAIIPITSVIVGSLFNFI